MKYILCFAIHLIFALSSFAQSAADLMQLKRDRVAELNALRNEFKNRKPSEDSLFVCLHSDWHLYYTLNFTETILPQGCANDFFNASKGAVIGPCEEDNEMKLYKVVDKYKSSDSVRVRHLLIMYAGAERAGPEIVRDKVQAKLLADSLMNVVLKHKAKLEDLVLDFTNDPGSLSGNLGDYGWFTKEMGFVQEFKDAGFNNEKGDVVMVETVFGYHIIQVVDKSPEKWNFKVEVLSKVIDWTKATFLVDPVNVNPPVFPGEPQAMQLYLKNNLQYPSKEKADKKEGVVWVYAKVNAAGTIVDFSSIIGVPDAPEFTAEAVRLISAMPKWIPATADRTPVSSTVAIPVVFCLTCN